MDNFNIGESAGYIWKYLEEFGEISSFELKARLAISNSKLFLALGWLLRENKIVMQEIDKGYKVRKAKVVFIYFGFFLRLILRRTVLEC